MNIGTYVYHIISYTYVSLNRSFFVIVVAAVVVVVVVVVAAVAVAVVVVAAVPYIDRNGIYPSVH